MKEWIPVSEGEYGVERSFLTAGKRAIALKDTLINVFRGKDGSLKMEGQGLLTNVLLMELLEGDYRLNLLLDFGNALIFCLKEPKIKAGKIFSPDIQSTIQFTPQTPWIKIEEAEFHRLLSEIIFLDPPV